MSQQIIRDKGGIPAKIAPAQWQGNIATHFAFIALIFIGIAWKIGSVTRRTFG